MYIYLISIVIICSILIYSKYFFNKKELFKNYKQEKIPKIIIQTWKDHNIPKKYDYDVSSVRKINKNFKILFFTDNDIEDFLKKYYPEYYLTYLKLPIFIQKIDFFRYIAVYHYGGFYYDLDISATYPLDELIYYDAVFPIEQIRGSCNKIRWKTLCKLQANIVLGNYAFGATPKNDFMKLLIDNIHDNIDKIIETQNKSNNYVYATTGPDYISAVYHNYKNKSSIKLLEDPSHKKQHVFGKYAKHNFYGTWKPNFIKK